MKGPARSSASLRATCRRSCSGSAIRPTARWRRSRSSTAARSARASAAATGTPQPEETRLKVFLSSDMEGTAGVVDWDQCIGDGPEAAAGRRLLLAEVNAAIEGALAAGATEVVVNDSHSTMRNLPPAELAGQASYIAGSHKPPYMMQGLDGTFDAVLFVSYHGSVGAPAGLSHTYNPRAVVEARLGRR